VATPCGNARDAIVLNEFTCVSKPNPTSLIRVFIEFLFLRVIIYSACGNARDAIVLNEFTRVSEPNLAFLIRVFIEFLFMYHNLFLILALEK
jgi:hypothetical protein